MWLRQITSSEVIVLACILDHLGQNDVAWPGLKRIAAECGISMVSAYNITKRLKRRRLLLVTPGGTTRSNSYKSGPKLEALQNAWILAAHDSRDFRAMQAVYTRYVDGIFEEDKREIRRKKLAAKRRKTLAQIRNPKEQKAKDDSNAIKRRVSNGVKKEVFNGVKNRRLTPLNRTYTKDNEHHKLNEEHIENRNAAKAATAASPAVHSSLRERQVPGFAPEALLNKVLAKLGKVFNVPSDKRGYRRKLLGTLNKYLVVIAKLQEQECSRRLGFAIPPDGFTSDSLRYALDDLLATAVRRKVHSLADLLEPALWDKAFPQLKLLDRLRKCAFSVRG
jgi:hypothetical protein